MMDKKQKQKGISLIEILLGAAVFAVALTLASGIFSSSVRYHKKAEATRQIDQQVRNGLDRIIYAIRNSSGFVGESGGDKYYDYKFTSGEGSGIFPGPANKGIKVGNDGWIKWFRFDDSNGNIGVSEFDEEDSDPIPPFSPIIGGRDIKVTEFKVEGREPVLKEDEITSGAYVKITLEAEYKDPRDRPELEDEKIHFITVVVPRDLDYYY